MTGWVSFQRDIFEHELFARDAAPMSEREAWMWLVAKAAWKDTRHRIGSVMHDVPRGSLFVTQRELQIAWKWKSLHKVQGFIDLLKNEVMIEVSAGSGKSQITICNYSKYQDAKVNEGSGLGSVGGQSGVSEGSLKEQDNNINKNINTHYVRIYPKKTNSDFDDPSIDFENPQPEPEASEPIAEPVAIAAKPKTARGTRIPEDWQPDVAAAAEIGLDPARIIIESAKFRDYWTAKATNATKRDWNATWRNWCRTAVEQKTNPKHAPPSSKMVHPHQVFKEIENELFPQNQRFNDGFGTIIDATALF